MPEVKHVHACCRNIFGPHIDVEEVVAREPALLMVDAAAVINELKRLMPQQKDPADFLAKNPRLVLDMQSVGLPSTIDGDLTLDS